MLRYVQNEKCNDPRNKALNQYEKSFKSQENNRSNYNAHGIDQDYLNRMLPYIQGPVNKTKGSHCEHKEERDLFCKECSHYICIKCANNYPHEIHHTVPKSDIEYKLFTLKSKLTKGKEKIEEMKKIKEKHFKLMAQVIDMRIEALIDEIMSFKSDCMRKLKEEYNKINISEKFLIQMDSEKVDIRSSVAALEAEIGGLEDKRNVKELLKYEIPQDLEKWIDSPGSFEFYPELEKIKLYINRIELKEIISFEKKNSLEYELNPDSIRFHFKENGKKIKNDKVLNHLFANNIYLESKKKNSIDFGTITEEVEQKKEKNNVPDFMYPYLIDVDYTYEKA